MLISSIAVKGMSNSILVLFVSISWLVAVIIVDAIPILWSYSSFPK